MAYMKKASSKSVKMSASKNTLKAKSKMEGKEMSFVEKMKAAKKKK